MSDADVNTLTINVRHLEGARALEVKANLFEREINKVLSLVEAHVEVMKGGSRAQEAEKRHQHDGILISGPRGSGKSTFMFTLRDRLKQQYSLDSTAKWKVEQLDVLDPSLIDGDEIFLATIVARIFGHLKAAKKEDDKGVTEALKHLAPAMLALDAKATRKKLGEVASSPALFGERLLSTALNGLDVQERFAKFTHAAASALGVQFFVLYLDDVDTAFRQGSQVLETVRRYCVDGTILPILTGDEKLFQLVVREQVWRDLRQLRKAERNKKQKANIDSQVDELEGQYLLKLLRPERRLNLPGARDRLAEFKTVNLTFEAQNEGTLQARLIDANQRIFCMTSKTEGGASLPYPAGELLTQNMRQIRAVIAWLGEMPKKEGEDGLSKDTSAALMQQHVLKMLDLHPQIQDTTVTREILTAILSQGNYQPLALWVCSHLGTHPRLYTLDPRTFGNEPNVEPWRIAVLAIHAALAQRWRLHPGEQLSFMGAVVVPALAINDVDRASQGPTLGANRQSVPTSWQLSGTTQEPWEISARVTASLIKDWQKSSEPYYLRLRINSSKGNGLERINAQFATKIGAPHDNAGETTEGQPPKTAKRAPPDESLTQKKNGTYYSGAGPWIYEGPAKYWNKESITGKEIIPSGAAWRSRVNRSVSYLLHWYTLPFRYYSSVFYAVDPLPGFIACGALMALKDAQIAPAVMSSADRDPFRIPLFSGQEDVEIDQAEADEVQSLSNDAAKAASLDFFPQIQLSITTWAYHAQRIINRDRVNPPRVISEITQRFRNSQMSIRQNLDSSYWTIGWILQTWALAFLNAALVAEGRSLGFRYLNEQNFASSDLRWLHNNKHEPQKRIESLLQNRRVQQNVFAKNLASVAEELKIESEVAEIRRAQASQGSVQPEQPVANDRDRPTLYLALATCPLIGGLLSDEWATLINHYNQLIFPSTGLKVQRITSTYLNHKKAPEFVSNESGESVKFDAFTLLCGLMTPETPQRTSKNSEKYTLLDAVKNDHVSRSGSTPSAETTNDSE